MTGASKQTNPVPYQADYFGHKLHCDQNEKMVMYGVTHVAAVDGWSGMIVGFVTMPINTTLRSILTCTSEWISFTRLPKLLFCYCRPIVLSYGLWDQIHVDQGKEWVLMLYVQETLEHLRFNTSTYKAHQTSEFINIIILYGYISLMCNF